MASASASVTTPRIPDHPSAVSSEVGGVGRFRGGDQPGRVRHRVHPEEPDHDRCGHDGHRMEQDAGRNLTGHPAELDAHQHEHQSGHEKIDRLPHHPVDQTRRRGAQLGGAPAEEEAECDHRQHARAAHPVGHDVGDVGHQQRDRRLDHRVVHPPPHRPRSPARPRVPPGCRPAPSVPSRRQWVPTRTRPSPPPRRRPGRPPARSRRSPALRRPESSPGGCPGRRGRRPPWPRPGPAGPPPLPGRTPPPRGARESRCARPPRLPPS